MFGASSGGSGGFGGFGQQQNQQPQQQQQQPGTGGVFGSGGTTGGFGSTGTAGTGFGQTGTGGGFGTTPGGFGQPQQQPQQQQNTGFGGTGFGATANTGFGSKPAFGSTPAAGTGLFGTTPAATTTTTGFGGGFGSGAATAGGFGSTTTPSSTAGGFGKPFGATTTTAGTTAGLFGTAGATNTGFGASNAIGFGSAAGTEVPVSGTSNPVFSATQEKDPAGSSMNHFQTISFMPAYQKFSLEELRLQDYLQGRRYGNATPGGAGAFGMNTGFGGGFGTQQQQQGTGFGNTGTTGGLFGAQQPQQQQPQQQTGFGATATTGAFGQPASTNTGLFGPAKPANTGLFGSTPAATNTGGGLFGSQPQGTTGFGATGTTGFGTQSTPAAGGGLFGSTPANTSSSLNTGTTGFGQQTQTGFGGTQPATQGGLFGNQATTTNSPFGTNQPAASTTPFGAAFGQNAQTQPQQNSFGTGFGTNQQQQQQQQQQQNKPFGTGFGTTPTPTAGTGLFGNTQQQQQQQQQQPAQGGGLFGNKPGFGTTMTPSTGGGLFGTTPATGTTGGGLFGTNQQTQQTTGGLFGGAPQNQQQNNGGLFGTKPAAGGLFGSTATPAASSTGGLYGSTYGGQQQGGTFGGNQQQQQPSMGTSGFFNSSAMGNQQGQGQQSQFFTSSINDPNPYGTNSVLGGSIQGSPGPLATPLGSVQKKKAAMLPQSKIAPRMAQMAPRLGSSFSRAGSPFASTSSGGSLTSSTVGKSLSSSTSKLHLFDTDDSVLSPGAFTPSAGSRVASLKRLVIDRNIRDADLFTGGNDLKGINSGKDDGKPKGILKKAVSFDANNSSRNYADLFGKDETQTPNNNRQYRSASPGAEELGYLRSPAAKGRRESGTQENIDTITETTVVQGNEVAVIGDTQEPVDEKGTYWMSPTLATLKAMPKEKLKHVTNLTVGRRGYGQVRFEPAVDLTNIPPEDIMDGIVVFQSRVCTVYPEHLPKPPPGKDLNVPSIISLEDCFPQYKDTRGPVKDPEHPRYIAHLNRLKSIKDTEFVDYLAIEGIWTFKVKHFTTYGLVDSDDEEEEGSYDEENATPRQSSFYDESSMLSEQSFISQSFDGDADVSGIVSDSSSAMDDTFEFKKLRSSVGSSVGGPRGYAGAMDEGSYEEGSTAEEDTTIEMQDQEESFLGEGSAGSVEEEEEEEEEEDLDEDEEPVEPEYTEEFDESVVIQSGAASPGEAPSTPMLSPIKQTTEPTPGVTPKALPLATNWADQLNLTISPVKRRTKMIMMSPIRAKPFDFSPQKKEIRNGMSEPLNYGHLDIMNDLFSGSMDSGGMKKARSPMKFNESPRQSRSNVRAISEDECNATVRPVWTSQGKLLYVGQLADNPKQGRPAPIMSSQLKVARLKFVPEKPTETTAMFELLLKHTYIRLDEYKVPFAEVMPTADFKVFSEVPWDDKPSSRYEKSVWRLASVLFDPVDEAIHDHVHDMYLENKARKEKLSRFLEESVERTADYHARTSASSEETALAHLTGHCIEQACAALIEGSCYKLATLVSMIGGDRAMRDDIRSQIVEWKIRGHLAEMSLPVRALYELLAGNTCFSDGLKKPYEDAAPSFFIPQQFNLDWKRTFGLKLWYGTTEDESIGEAVSLYEKDFHDDYPGNVQKPTPWYYPDDSDTDQYDLLWGLLKIYADDRVPLQSILTTKWADRTHDDYRLPWQLRNLMSRRLIRDFSMTSEEKAHGITISERADELTVNYAAQLEAQGHWHWAMFVLMHLLDTDSRELAIRALLARNVDDLEDGSEKLMFLKETLMLRDQWIFEAKALHARHLQLHVKEAEYLLAAQTWTEAHKTMVQQVAPAAVISGDLEQLRTLLAKFEDVNKVSNWALGGQVYLDYITLLNLKNDLPAAMAAVTPPAPSSAARGTRGGSAAALGGRNDLVQVCRRLLAALPNMEMINFEQRVAVKEMGAVVSGVVLKVGGVLTSEAPKILGLPLTEDQYLKKTVRLSLEYYKARLVEAR